MIVAEFNYGGQAVMEGVMMRGSKVMAVAVRAPNDRIVVHTEPLNQAIYGSWPAKVPFVRGITMLWDTLVLGMRTLMFSADIAMQNEPSGNGSTQGGAPESAFSAPLAWGSIALAVVMAVGLFFLLPAFLTRLIDRYIASALLSNLVEGLIRLAFVLAYIWAVGFVPDIARVFRYHGAEHKTIHTYEEGMPLTVEAIQGHTTAHSRCGTAFILVVMVISVLIFALLGRPTLWIRLLSRIVLLPVIVGISYEWLKFSARHADKGWMRVLLLPGLALQRLTTREPDDKMVEVAMTALKRVLQEEGVALVATENTENKEI
ncbi:MAG: DUF1385 domain-containing protein [Anaerolineae bacterium]|nr:DUF1385 domain-containing protein [Anaerolineae bacterium]